MKKDAEDCKKSCDLITRAMGGRGIAVMRQIHSAEVIYIDAPTKYGSEPEVDAIVTDKPGLVLGVQTADCVPILFASGRGDIIGAAHAGWRGAKSGIIENTIKAMQNMGATDIYAVMGPSIQQASYEVDEGFYESFIGDNLSNQQFFIESHNPHKKLFDIPSYAQHKLAKCGIQHIIRNMDDTYSMDSKYHSYRRSCHTGEPYNGSLLSAIMIK